MARKITGYYNDTDKFGISDADQLTIAVGDDELVCLVKGAESGEVEGFEYFAVEEDKADWPEILHGIVSDSRLLDRVYRNIQCIYHFDEALLIPLKKFTATAAEDYLALLYGESDQHVTRHADTAEDMVTAFRIRRSLQELFGRQFLLHKPGHVYTNITNDVLSRPEPDEHFIKVQFYARRMIVAVAQKHTLLLIRSFSFDTYEDVLYHLANVAQQFGFNPAQSHIEISGKFETGSLLHQNLQPLFGLISFDGTQSGVLRAASGYPSHYFAPFVKLVV